MLLLILLLLSWYLLDVVANLLNTRAIARELPATFETVYDQGQYQRLQSYNKANTKLELLESTTVLATLLAFLVAGGFPLLDRIVRSWGMGLIPTGLAFIGALVLSGRLIELPFDLYHTFRIEKRFGFNRTSWGTWCADKLKSWLISAMLGGGVLTLLLFLLERAGNWAWLYGWAATVLLMLLLTWAAPTVIMPLFNKFTPLESGELRSAISDFGKAHDFPIAGIYVMDGSRRSTKSNAFFTGLGKTKKIALFDTLLAQHSIPELVAVLAHEIGHYKLGHIPRRLMLAIGNLGLFFLLAQWVLKSPVLYSSFGLEPSVYAGLPLFVLFYTPISRFLGIAAAAMSRRHEYEADRFAAETTGKPQALIDALRKLSKANLSNLKPHRLYVLLYHSHPPVLERIAALERVQVSGP